MVAKKVLATKLQATEKNWSEMHCTSLPLLYIIITAIVPYVQVAVKSDNAVIAIYRNLS
ncbi:MAG: hypothetical protein IKL83_04285 [Muribaculaceae bacterium]|nr:hypothetical protein [Muribaculaceae bacterium]